MPLEERRHSGTPPAAHRWKRTSPWLQQFRGAHRDESHKYRADVATPSPIRRGGNIINAPYRGAESPQRRDDKTLGDTSFNDVISCLRRVLSQETVYQAAFILACASVLAVLSVLSGAHYTPWLDVLVLCVFYAFWICHCLPWLILRLDGKKILLLVGVVLRLFAAELFLLAWGHFRGHRDVLQRALRLRPVLEPSLSWLPQAGYCLRYGVIVAAVVTCISSLTQNFVEKISRLLRHRRLSPTTKPSPTKSSTAANIPEHSTKSLDLQDRRSDRRTSPFVLGGDRPRFGVGAKASLPAHGVGGKNLFNQLRCDKDLNPNEIDIVERFFDSSYSLCRPNRGRNGAIGRGSATRNEILDTNFGGTQSFFLDSGSGGDTGYNTRMYNRKPSAVVFKGVSPTEREGQRGALRRGGSREQLVDNIVDASGVVDPTERRNRSADTPKLRYRGWKTTKCRTGGKRAGFETNAASRTRKDADLTLSPPAGLLHNHATTKDLLKTVSGQTTKGLLNKGVVVSAGKWKGRAGADPRPDLQPPVRVRADGNNATTTTFTKEAAARSRSRWSLGSNQRQLFQREFLPDVSGGARGGLDDSSPQQDLEKTWEDLSSVRL
ncbi:uncharacterized protein LOC101855536 isoform X2 [Aplysia californica]|uniref:Uncharacterized protein LOC101855536 isoform X2 n=1 Tax=Aplysia californica TaxID=6500 RepID=A0ABM1AD68_APLCA|nr:uncharacterized protein LOC101855536 isoform X2 [Aplysia californica]